MEESPTIAHEDVAEDSKVEQSSARYVTRWNRLVSRTNWEKGRIICQWRESLSAAGSPPNAYSDETWAQRVGGVSAGHVGRLRRVWQKYGEVREEYSGLYWSHFLVALEWDDAEMWLEGAVKSGWSVSQMRGKRWEALGAPDELKPGDDQIMEAEIAGEGASGAVVHAQPATTAAVRDVAPQPGSPSHVDTAATLPETTTADAPEAHRPLAELPEMPDDLAEAFEQFKLAILNHKLTQWKSISRDEVLASLDALKELALAEG